MKTLVRVSDCHNGFCKPELDQVEYEMVASDDLDCTCSEINFEGKHVIELSDSGKLLGEWCLWHGTQLRLD